jgi:hypothetical protein
VALLSTTVEKLIRTHLTPVGPGGALKLGEIDVAEVQAQLAACLGSRAEVLLPNTHNGGGYSYRGQSDFKNVLILKIYDDERTYQWRPETYALLASTKDELAIRRDWSSGPPAFVPSLPALLAFVKGLMEAREKANVAAQKREKVKTLKSAALQGQLRQLAKAEQFNFAVTEGTNHLHLLIEIGERSFIEVGFRFSKFHEVMPTLPSTIKALRHLTQSGVSFRHSQARSHKYGTLIQFKDL